jgi:hypothetical protein
MKEIEDFIKEIENFAAQHNMSDTGVSIFLARSPGYLSRLRSGRDTGTRKAMSIRQKMAAHNKKVNRQ